MASDFFGILKASYSFICW